MNIQMPAKKMNLREIYCTLKEEPSPAQKFISDIATLTCREEKTVRQWLSGVQTPPRLVQEKIAEYVGHPVEELFPEEYENKPDNKPTEAN